MYLPALEAVDGYDLYVKLGQLKNKGDWLAAYCYARIEQFAVNDSLITHSLLGLVVSNGNDNERGGRPEGKGPSGAFVSP